MLNNKKTIFTYRNPYLLFAPFLIICIILIFIFHTDANKGDEGKYLAYAHNLCHGFYSPLPNVDLEKGPGYPIIIMPFVALGLPLVCIVLLNAFFYYLSIVFVFKALQQIVSFKIAMICSLFWAFNYNLYEPMFLILTEIFAAFLVTLLIFAVVKFFTTPDKKTSRRYFYLAGITLGFLALTKIVFGYVIFVLLIAAGLCWLIKRRSNNFKKAFLISALALATTLPYLIYTYSITNKIFYWGTSGGNTLYWMTTPYENEYGSWFVDPTVTPDSADQSKYLASANSTLLERHGKIFSQISQLSLVEQDDAFKKAAFENIKAHPQKFIENCISNIGRMFFNMPFSYKLQKPATLIRLPYNGILLTLALFCMIPTVVNWKKLHFSVRFLLWFGLIYFAGSILGSAEIRASTIVVPVIIFWVAYIIDKTVKIKLKFKEPLHN